MFSFVINKSWPELLCVIIDVFAKVEHYCHPNIIRRDLDVSMVNVGFKKGLEKSILMLLSQRTAFLIAINLFHQIFVPQLFSLNFLWLTDSYLLLKFLNRDCLIVLEVCSCFNCRIFKVQSLSFQLNEDFI